ncbi:hypothetical protein PanWU01x14_180910 [Parasponia andersonii]|uniref:Uncharacterized protein n=1 Tax=Parasponia andersonii TaxID=3476 RepID=A0A2P5C664_PARAD|nr:hypothetical protein PanWU01x14_180910 [Parasponia andersonii]
MRGGSEPGGKKGRGKLKRNAVAGDRARVLPRDRRIYSALYYNDFRRRCRGSNPGHPRDRREYLPLYYNDCAK